MAANYVIARKWQTKAARNGTYMGLCTHCKGDGCSCGNCSSETKWSSGHQNEVGVADWRFRLDTCCTGCPQRPTYSEADRSQCAVGLDAFNQDPVVRADFVETSDSAKNAPLIQCTFDGLRFSRAIQILNFQAMFPEVEEVQWNRLMNRYCSEIQEYPAPSNSECKANVNVGETPRRCSRYSSISAESETCRSWFNSVTPQVQDTFIERVANSTGPQLLENRCSNRGQYDDYMLFAPAFTFADQCWFIPCRDTTNYLVKSDLAQAPGLCPANVCAQVIAVGSANNVNFADLNLSISCNFNDAAARTYACSDQSQGEERCIFAGCDPFQDTNCHENDSTCNGRCPRASTFECVRGSCEPQLCDPEESMSCFQSDNCNNTCTSGNQTWRYLNGQCFPGQCSPIDNVVCFSERTCGGLLAPSSPLSPIYIMMIIIMVIVIIVVIVAVSTKQVKDNQRKKASLPFSLPTPALSTLSPPSPPLLV